MLCLSERGEVMLAFFVALELIVPKVAYFTFDDGPSDYTIPIMDVLEEHEISGLFFVIGKYLDEYANGEAVVQEVINRHHDIGLHSMSHRKSTLYHQANAAYQFTAEMKALQQRLLQLTGYQSNVCRAPYSRRLYFSPAHYASLKQANIQYLDWNVDSRDWSNISNEQIVENVKNGIRVLADDSVIVILFHETAETLEALPDIIDYLKSQSYTFGVYDDISQLQQFMLNN